MLYYGIILWKLIKPVNFKLSNGTEFGGNFWHKKFWKMSEIESWKLAVIYYLLEVEGVEPSNILTELYHSCALIFDEVCVDGVTPADSRDTINGDKFHWVDETAPLSHRAKALSGQENVPCAGQCLISSSPRARLVLTVQQEEGSARRLPPSARRAEHHRRRQTQYSCQQVQCKRRQSSRRSDAGPAEDGCEAAPRRASRDQHHCTAAADG